MSYTLFILATGYRVANYSNQRSARAAMRRANGGTRINRIIVDNADAESCTIDNTVCYGTYAVMEWRAYETKHNYMITVNSLMSGNPVEIRKQDRGSCTDPSTERYWSM